MPEKVYRYLGVWLWSGNTDDLPVGVIRAWTDETGYERAENFTRDLTWERTFRLSEPTNDQIIEIDESVVDRFIRHVTRNLKGKR